VDAWARIARGRAGLTRRIRRNRSLAGAAQLGDADGVGAIQVRAWQATYRGVMPDAYLDEHPSVDDLTLLLSHRHVSAEVIMRVTARLGAEFAGTFVLVFCGTGSAVLAATFLTPLGADSGLGIGIAGVSLAFGLTVVTMAYAVGHISGGHFNPAITLGLAAARRFDWKDAIPYIVTQVLAAIAASATLWVIAINHEGTTKDSLAAGGFAANGYGDHSPGQYNLFAGLVIEIVLTAVFLIVIMGTTDKRASKGFAALAIGLALTLIHLVSIPVTNTSVNPARSTGPAILLAFGGESWGLEQLWLFWLAPIVGGLLGALGYQIVAEPQTVSDAAVMGVDATGPAGNDEF
jgi:aquaporin Z